VNIFVSYPDPVKCAQVLDDGRVNKMITESLQMLAVVMHRYGVPIVHIPRNVDGYPFSATAHAKHPCTLWAGECGANFMWLVEHTRALCGEFERRYGRPQRGSSNLHGLEHALPYLPIGDQTPFVNCSMYKSNLDIHAAYRDTLMYKWMYKSTKYRLTWAGQPKFPGWP
jgi:Pyrimidine dimer DNA glycosylase